MNGLEPEIAKLKVGFRAGNDLAVNMGYVGTGLMLMAMLYPLRKRFKFLQWLSTSASWFDFHLMGGVVGPLFICMHSALRLDNWVSIAFWSMIIVVMSGIVGRYLYVQVPELLSAQDFSDLEHERAIAKHRASLGDTVVAHRQGARPPIARAPSRWRRSWAAWPPSSGCSGTSSSGPDRWGRRKVLLGRTKRQRQDAP